MSSPLPKNMPDFHLMTSLMTHKLDKNNYPSWLFQIQPLLKSQDLLKFVEDSSPPLKDQNEAEFDQWHRTDQLLLSWLFTTLSDPIVELVSGQKTSKELWDALLRMFKSHEQVHIQDLKKQIQNVKMGDSTVEEYVHRVKALANRLDMLGSHVKDEELIEYTLNGLPDVPGYETFSSMKITKNNQPKDFYELNEMLYKNEFRLTGRSIVTINVEAPEKGTKATNPAGGFLKQVPSKASVLINFLPSGTLMIFNMLIAPISENGKCSTVNFVMMINLLTFCVLSCCFFQLVDSFHDGKKVYHGIVTKKGLLLFTSDHTKKKYHNEGDKYKLKITDVVHAFMSVIVFAVFALSDKRVRECLMPAHETVVAEIMKSLPLIVSIACSGLVLIFPNTRFGVGMRG